MPLPEDSTQPDFWNTRYAAGKTPWDLGGVPGALRSFLARTTAPAHVLIPGCGSGYEVQAFHDAGFEVTAIDFSPAARERASRLLGPLGQCVVAGDFFRHDFSGQKFDLIYERTFLCSLPPARWPAYARRMAELLEKGKRPRRNLPVWRGARAAALSAHGSAGAPAPWANEFDLIRSELVSDSLPLFKGMEAGRNGDENNRAASDHFHKKLTSSLRPEGLR